MGRSDRWFCAHTQAGKEQLATFQLENQGFDAFCPLIWRTIRHARQFRRAQRALFPRYVFVKLDLDRDSWLSVNGTLGVVRLVMSGESPAAVPRGFVERLQNNIVGGVLARDFDMPNVGEQVRLLTGPFANQIALVDQLDDAGRVRLLLSLMGRSIPVWAAQDAVAPFG